MCSHQMLQRLPHAILFDWDNTLVDSWALLYLVLNMTLKEYGKKEWSVEEVRARTHHSMRDAFPQMFGTQWEEAGKRFYEIYQSIHLEHLKPLPHAEEVLKKLQELGIYVGIVSNKNGKFLRTEVEVLKWQEYFASIVGATDAARDKPAPDVIHLALENLPKYQHTDIWLIGDTKVDIECARNFGCHAILFGHEALTHWQEGAQMADRHILNHMEMLKLLMDLS